MKFIKTASLSALLALSVTYVALAGTILVTVKLPNGAPARHAVIQMYKEQPNYLIRVYEKKTTDSSGSAVFQLKPGACFKGEYGSDGSGRPTHVGGECPKGSAKTLTITLD